MFPNAKKLSTLAAAFLLCLALGAPAYAQAQLKGLSLDVSELLGIDLSQVEAQERHPLSQDAAARILKSDEVAWQQVPATLAAGEVFLLQVPDAWLGRSLQVKNGLQYSLLWRRQGNIQASWIRTQGRALMVPRAKSGALYLLLENPGEERTPLRLAHKPLSHELTRLNQFTVAPLGPLAASISWVAYEQPDVRAWILEKRNPGGKWEPVMAAPLPVRSQGEASYGTMDVNRPGPQGAYRLVAVDASGFLVVYRTIKLSE